MPILDFPPTRQATIVSCGAVAVQGVLYYYGVEKREDELNEALGTTDEGVPARAIVEYLRDCGFQVTARSMTLDQLKRSIDGKVPVILMVQAWADDACDYATSQDEGHYVVAIGYDDVNRRVIFEDPSLLGHRGFMTYDELEARWHEVEDGRLYDHFGIAVSGRTPTYDPDKLMHIGSRVAARWARQVLRRVGTGWGTSSASTR